MHTLKYERLVLVVLLAAFINLVFINLVDAADLTEFQKETIESIREITLQLILISMGVFALVGGFISTSTKTLNCKVLLWLAFVLLAASIVVGLFAYGNLIYGLGNNTFEPFGNIRELAKWQWVAFGVGGIFFALFVLCNIGQKNK